MYALAHGALPHVIKDFSPLHLILERNLNLD